MHNIVCLIGRMENTPELVIKPDGRKRVEIKLAVTRTYKNADGIYETDHLDIVLWNALAQHTVDYLKPGTLVSVKGRIQNTDNGNEIIADKISYLANGRGDDGYES